MEQRGGESNIPETQEASAATSKLAHLRQGKPNQTSVLCEGC